MNHLTVRIVFAAGTLICLLAAPAAGQAGLVGPGTCSSLAVAIGDPTGYVPLPRGDLFCSLIADPKDMHSFATFLWGQSDALDTRIGAVGIADEFGLVRIGAPDRGIQLSLAGGVFSQFDLDSPSFDLLNADYLIGLPLTFRYGGFSGRARVYHQSSHLGDEFLLREDEPERENISFESVELIFSQEFGALRPYAGGEYLFNREPETLEQTLVHGGVEFRQPTPVLRLGSLGDARLIAGVDVKSSEEQEWSPALSLRAGFEVGRGQMTELPERRWALLFEAYDGPSPYGQFYREDISYIGVGFHFGL